MSQHRRLPGRRPLWIVPLRIATPLLAIAAFITGPIGYTGALGAGPIAASAAIATAPDFTATKTVTRVHLKPDGTDDLVDSRTVHLSVDVTKSLHTLQQVNVTWSGARPSNFIYTDVNSAGAATYAEYPMVLLECRGVDSTSATPAQQLTPQSCWTQSSAERNEISYGSAFPSWRLDRYASAADREQYVNAPNPLPTGCSQSALGKADYFVPLRAAGGTAYYSGPTAACSELSPEQSNFGGDFPDNVTFGVTASDGTGRAKFVMWSNETNATLGCSSTVPCSLVAIPIVGVSCDERPQTGLAASDITSCTYHDDNSGQLANASSELASPGLAALQAVDGLSWWAASNWRNRITVPLTFAPPANYCAIVSAKTPVLIYGSELFSELAQQWMPKFCTDATKTPFTHVPQAEPAAVNEFTQHSIDAVLSSYPPAASRSSPLVNAPVAVTGFAVATAVDDADGHEVTSLRFDARLLAKLLSESYPDLTELAQGDGASADGSTPGPMAHNPLNITLDPEFKALNPGIPQETAPAGSYFADERSELMALSSNSDVMRAVTSYINADLEARAFLDGHPDPWGMVVNPNYKGIRLPTDFWELKDSFLPMQYYESDSTSCFAQKQFQTPFLPLVAAPLLTLQSIAYNMEFALPNSTTYCNVNTLNPAADKLGAGPREQPGKRFLLGIVSLAEAARYDLDTAQLENRSAVDLGTRFADASGRTFAAPSDASLRAATSYLASDATLGTWTVDYSKLQSKQAAGSAYPGVMLASMSVPTVGLSRSDATAYADVLHFAAGPGQTPGEEFGQLPPGYLPMTAANGLGSLANYTARAADAVARQQCGLPSLTSQTSVIGTGAGCPTAQPVSQQVGGGSGGTKSSTGGSLASGQSTGSTSGTGTSGSKQPAAKTLQAPVTSTTSQPALAAGVTPSSAVGAIGNLLPLLLVGGAALGTLTLVGQSVSERRRRLLGAAA